MNSLDDFLMSRPPTADRPLLGMTVLLVEDSRFAAEGFRLLCQRSGARLRRAGNLHHARRHLCVYRPTMAIIDLGLPDGSGTKLIADLANSSPRVEAILATSGDPDTEQEAMDAGADGFLAKPVNSLASFQATVLALLPADRQPPAPRKLSSVQIRPDELAFRDDLVHAAEVLSKREDSDVLDYLTQFLGGVARSAGDEPLSEAVNNLAAVRANGGAVLPVIDTLSSLVETRLTPPAPMG